MIRKGYSPKTIQTYVNHIQHLNRELDNNITPERIDGYLNSALREKIKSYLREPDDKCSQSILKIPL